jgi:hypothetical protein
MNGGTEPDIDELHRRVQALSDASAETHADELDEICTELDRALDDVGEPSAG